MAVLITGGAGYIGSHAVKYFMNKGLEVVVVDNLATGHQEALSQVPFYEVDLRDVSGLSKVFKQHTIESVIHFAASSIVSDSMNDPLEYYQNNLYGTMCLLEVMKNFGVKQLVFSSTAATYGEPKQVPIKESDPTHPTNAYGETKLAMEKMMRWFDSAYGIKFCALRYFNAAGAWTDGSIGEAHKKETHLIPLVIKVALGQESHIKVFGDDYPTEDGSCIRDYIHVLDLASAHHLAYLYLKNGGESDVFNLGSGTGFSVKAVIETTRAITGHPIPQAIHPRRSGDPAVLIASADKAKAILGWTPERDDLKTIIEDAWRFHLAHPSGYQA